MTLLRAHTAALHEAEMEHLGDEITYSREGGGVSTFNAWVDFGSEHISSPGSAATAATVTVEILRRRIAEPVRSDRIRIKLRPGMVFAPADIRDGPTGETWILALRKVPG